MKLDDYLYQGTAATLGIMRIVVFGLCFVYVLGVPYGQLEILPPTLHNPTLLIDLLPKAWKTFLISESGLVIVKPLLLFCLICAIVGLRPFHLWAVAAVVLLLVFDMVYKGYAFFFWHGQFALIYCAAVLAISPCADSYRLFTTGLPSTRQDGAYQAPPLLLGLAMTTCYALLGTRRLVEGHALIYLDDSILDFTAVRAFEPAYFTFQAGFWPLHSPILAVFLKIGFAVVTVFEALSPLAVVFKRFRLFWLIVIVPFHLVTLFTMNIFFWENALLLLLLFTPFAYRLGQTPKGTRPVVFFDGSCGLCHDAVQWLGKRDKKNHLCFAPLGGETARREGLGARDSATSMFLRDEAGLHDRSTAALRALLPLGGAWAAAGSLLLSVPQPIRNIAYKVVAKNRYRFFGRCEIATTSSISEKLLP